MTADFKIRPTTAADAPSLQTLYPAAFAEEDLWPLVDRLLALPADVVSLAAILDGAIAGHALFSLCGVGDRDRCAALLGPLAVTPELQRRGVGGALVRDGFDRLAPMGAAQIFVLGDPVYYARFGFEREDAVAPPYELPTEWLNAWRSVCLGGAPRLAGALRPPAPWLTRSLWAP